MSVEAQQADPASTLAFVRALLHLRSREPALQSGRQRLISTGPDVFCFERQLGKRFLVALNFTSRSIPLELEEDVGCDAVLELSTDPERDRGVLDPHALILHPDEGLILRLR